MNYQAILDSIQREIEPYIGQGDVASYIPELARVNGEQFGMALYTIEGDMFEVGSTQELFSIQSISKLFTLTLALKNCGRTIWQRVGREPSGTAFNSLVQLEHEQGIPRNPFVNAGALVVTDLLCSFYRNAKYSVLELLRELSGNPALDFDMAVAESEKSHGFRNVAMANFMKSFGNIKNDIEAVTDAYFHHCSIPMSCRDLARSCHYLIDGGRLSGGNNALISAREAKYINAIMMTSGTYDAAGEFAYRVGLPCKSGVGGGIIAIMPGKFSVCVWSPGLDKNGNSLVGLKALDALTTKTAVSIF